MSRIGRLPVEIPEGVDVKVQGSHVRVIGPKGELKHTFPAAMEIKLEGDQLSAPIYELQRIQAIDIGISPVRTAA